MRHASGPVRPLRWRRLRGLIIGGCLALLAAAASLTPVVETWEEAADLQFLFRARGARTPPDEVVVVPIDGRAARRLFLPALADDFERCRDVRLDEPLPGYRNPDPPEVLTRWPRCLHARALEALAAAQPDVVVIDIQFRPRSDPSGAFAMQDRALVEAIRHVGSVVLAQKLKSDPGREERFEPLGGEIEQAALGVAPFLLLGAGLQRAGKFSAFKDEHDGWAGPCLPAVVHQAVAIEAYVEWRELLAGAALDHVDLLPEHADELVRQGALQAPVQLVRRLVNADR